MKGIIRNGRIAAVLIAAIIAAAACIAVGCAIPAAIEDAAVPADNHAGIGSDRRTLSMYGDIVTAVKRAAADAPSGGPVFETDYGTVDCSNAWQGYIRFTACGEERMLVLQAGDAGAKAMFRVPAGEAVTAILADGAGTYSFAIGKRKEDGSSFAVAYKDSFTIERIASDLAPYLESTPYGDYENAPAASAKAAELHDPSASSLENIKIMAEYVASLEYDLDLMHGSPSAYVDPDEVIAAGGGVCNDFSKLLVAMLRSQGIPAYYVCGNDGEHAWAMAWAELDAYEAGGAEYAEGAWVLVESTNGTIVGKEKAAAGYTTEGTANYAN